MVDVTAFGATSGGATGVPAILDAHVHFWDPTQLQYPWLERLPALGRPFLSPDYSTATAGVPIDTVILVEANCLPNQTHREVDFFERAAASDGRVAGIVAYASLTAQWELDRTLDALSAVPRVKGIRHNIQGEGPGFCTQTAFVDGVQKVGSRGLTFDLCATHDQLRDVFELVRECPNTRFVLDHCGKPAIRDRLLDPWRADLARLADCVNVWCKVSGLLTEAARGWQDADVLPYASHVIEHFGPERVIYGSDWPVLTLAGGYTDWFGFAERLTAGWSDAERRGFFCDNARRAYAI